MEPREPVPLGVFPGSRMGVVLPSLPVRRMRWLAAAVALAAVLAPLSLRGDPLSFPPVDVREPQASRRAVTHTEWAARLVEGLGLHGALDPDHDARDVFGLLCPDARELGTGAGGRRVPVGRALQVRVDDVRLGGSEEPRHISVSLPGSALYALVVHGQGQQRWWVDGREVGVLDPGPLGVDWAPTLQPLAPGPHQLAVELSPAARVQQIELVAWRSLCIAPAGGWSAGRALTFGAKARTLVQAFGLEHRLPEEGSPRVREGEHFDASRGGARSQRRLGRPASAGAWAVAGPEPAEFEWHLVLEQPGVYGLAARVHGAARQIWEVDGRYGMALQPHADAADFAWETILTLPLPAGEHVVRARLAAGSGVDALRLVRRRADEAAYLGVLRELGLREGAPDAVVDEAAASANLESPVFRTLVAGFLARFGTPPGNEMVRIEHELRRLYDRPLSPMLPGEL